MIPLLFECELEPLFSAVWSIGASRATQMRRLQARGLSETEAAQRLASQLSVAEKMARSTRVFWGEGTVATLHRQLDQG